MIYWQHTEIKQVSKYTVTKFRKLLASFQNIYQVQEDLGFVFWSFGLTDYNNDILMN